jgi:hypothetical protein
MMLADLIASRLAQPDRDINHILAYGQSLPCDGEGSPLLPSRPRHDTLMLGQSVHSARRQGESWEPIGAPRLRPLITTVQNVNTGQRLDTVLSGQAVTVGGETALETALNEWRGRALASGHAKIGVNRLLGSSCGVGGQSVESLMRDAAPNLFQQLRQCALSAQAAAHAIGQNYGITALLLLHDEANNLEKNGISGDIATYKTLLRRFCADFYADAESVTGQGTRPLIFTYQTGGAFAIDGNEIAQAQLELTLESPGIVMVAPVYSLPHTQSGRLDANGYRWLGAQFGKVMHRVLDTGQIFRPTHPIIAKCQDTTVTVAFSVPVPPLAWGNPIPSQFHSTVQNRGFAARDELGEIPIVSVEIDGPESVRIALSRRPEGKAVLAYASATTGGRGCLHDSDREMSAARYQIMHSPPDGFETPAALLEGKPYQLVNWCAAFTIKIGCAT